MVDSPQLATVLAVALASFSGCMLLDLSTRQSQALAPQASPESRYISPALGEKAITNSEVE
jgi:hypothetical protein